MREERLQIAAVDIAVIVIVAVEGEMICGSCGGGGSSNIQLF